MSTEPKHVKLPTQILRNGGKDAAGICLRCGKPVALDKAAVLEQSSRFAEWHDFGMPSDESWGPALFGDICAKHMRRRARYEMGGKSDPDISRKDYLENMLASLVETLEQRPEPHSLDEHYEFMVRVIRRQLAMITKPNLDLSE